MRLRADVNNARLLCFNTLSHTIVRSVDVQEIGPTDKSVWTQLNDALTGDRTTAKREGKGKPFDLTLE